MRNLSLSNFTHAIGFAALVSFITAFGYTSANANCCAYSWTFTNSTSHLIDGSGAFATDSNNNVLFALDATGHRLDYNANWVGANEPFFDLGFTSVSLDVNNHYHLNLAQVSNSIFETGSTVSALTPAESSLTLAVAFTASGSPSLSKTLLQICSSLMAIPAYKVVTRLAGLLSVVELSKAFSLYRRYPNPPPGQ